MTDVRHLSFSHRRSADQDRAAPAQHPIVIVGAGPVGLVAALDLARKGHRSVVIEPRSNLSDGSRAICWAKRSLEIMDRLGLGQALVDKGVTWKNGKVFFDNARCSRSICCPRTGTAGRPSSTCSSIISSMPASRRQPDRPDRNALAGGGSGLEQTADGALLTISTPDGPIASWPTG